MRRLLEDRVGRVLVVGEVSNLFRAASGHVYFTLKDEGGQIRAALFRSAARRVPFELEEGLEVVVDGDAGIYEARGELQLVVRALEPRGQGALQLALEQLRARLEAEGLFDDARKRALPAHPKTLGVVTSAAGAALRDVIHVSGRRFPGARLLLSPTRVQGDGAEHEIAAALDRLSARDDVDVVLLVRGGGSLEDLWAFNLEPVARAIARCAHPVVSGVGHETDFTIADWTADARAPTPSAAAALALPDRLALAERLEARWSRLLAGVDAGLERRRSRLAREGDALRSLAPSARLAAGRSRLKAAARTLGHLVRSESAWRRRRLDALHARLAPPDLAARRARAASAGRALSSGMARSAERARARLSAGAGRLDSLSPLAVLGRGYALVQRDEDDAIVRDPADVAVGERVRVRVARGELRAAVEAIRRLPEPGED